MTAAEQGSPRTVEAEFSDDEVASGEPGRGDTPSGRVRVADRRPRILFVSYTADWRGPTRSLVHLIDHLEDAYRPAVVLAGEGGFGEALDEREIPTFRFDRLDKWSIPRMAGIIRRHGFDLVYANATHGSARNAFLAAKLAGRPYVCHVRAMGWGKTWMRLGYLRFADAVVAVSEACAESVRRFVRPERLHVVHNGVPRETVVAPTDEGGTADSVRESMGVPPDAVVLLSVAHLCPRKGQLRLVEALARLEISDPPVHLCLVGATDRDVDYVRRLRERAERSGVDERLHVLGFRDDVEEIMRESDVFVHAAREDPHPRAVIEAMGSGLPVVAFGVDGVSETVEPGVTGRLVGDGDSEAMATALEELIRSPGRRRKWGAAGRNRVLREFTAENNAAEVGRIVDSVVGAVRQPPGPEPTGREDRQAKERLVEAADNEP